MSKKELARSGILKQIVLPLFYHESEETSIEILRALYRGGIRVVEYTNRGDAAARNFRKLKNTAAKEMEDMILGIGTIKSGNAAKEFVEAEADFIICPSINAEVGEIVNRAGLLWIPGCMTPSEIAQAENMGAELIKIFPGNLLGPAYLKSIRDLFPRTQFLITGGVEPEKKNIREWMQAGAKGVGLGSRLITQNIINAKNYDQLENNTRKLLEDIEKIDT